MAKPRTHMAGKSMFYAGTSALCWKWPKRIKDPDDYATNWRDVTCMRCLALKPDYVSSAGGYRSRASPFPGCVVIGSFIDPDTGENYNLYGLRKGAPMNGKEKNIEQRLQHEIDKHRSTRGEGHIGFNEALLVDALAEIKTLRAKVPNADVADSRHPPYSAN